MLIGDHRGHRPHHRLGGSRSGAGCHDVPIRMAVSSLAWSNRTLKASAVRNGSAALAIRATAICADYSPWAGDANGA